MEENIGKAEGRSAAAETASEKPKMGNLFAFSMPHVDLPVLIEGMIPVTLGICGNDGTITLKEDEPLNDWLNQVLISLLNDLVEHFEGIINEAHFPVDTADRDGLLGPPPNEQELAEIEATDKAFTDKAFNEAGAAKLQKRQAWAKQRLEECQGAKAKLLARPIRF